MIKVVYENMPERITAFTACDLQDNYTVVVNSKMSYERQQKAYRHELAHIENSHFNREMDCDMAEASLKMTSI